MEYRKIINLFDNTPNQLSKFRTKNWVEINFDSFGMYNTNSQIKFKTLMTVSFCHVTYAFQSESTLYSCLNVKELLARSRGEI